MDSKARAREESDDGARAQSQPITDALARSAVLPPGKQKLILNDAPTKAGDRSYVPGFGLRLTSGGAKTFVLRYRADGRDRVVRIGAYGAWSVAAAREKARELRHNVDGGGDPAAERADANATPTLAEVFARFVKEYGHRLRPATLTAYKAQFRNHVAGALGRWKIAKIEHEHVVALHNKVTAKGGAHVANRMVALLSRVFTLATKWRLVEGNPCKGVERNQEHKRKRYLKRDEAQRLLAALPRLRHAQSANAIRLLILTGARRMEVLAARWDQFDLTTGIWTKPASTTKQKLEHVVPLAAAAVALLLDLRAAADARDAADVAKASGDTKALAKIAERAQWVFPAHGAEGHQSDLKNGWAKVQELAGLADLRVHDLRHSFASFLASGGATLPVIGAMLGHSQPATTARYAHLFDDVQRAAADKVGDLLATLGSTK